MFDLVQYALGGVSGGLVGFTLGLVGGGGSILAVPLMVYLVGVQNPHVAIGTSAFAVAANAAAGLFNHARAGTVKWRCGISAAAAAGVIGAFAGSSVGKVIGGEELLFFFALVMFLVSIMMFRRRCDQGEPGAECDRQKAPKVLTFGLATGAFSGFFGIGGGFMIVPGLVSSTKMPILNAVGTSLVAVTAFGLTTALNYASSGFVNWPLAFVFIAGGMLGSLAGMKAAHQLASRSGRLATLFAILIFVVATYMLYRSGSAILA